MPVALGQTILHQFASLPSSLKKQSYTENHHQLAANDAQ